MQQSSSLNEAQTLLTDRQTFLKLITSVLTARSFAVVPEITLLRLSGDASLLPHLVDLRHAQFRVQSKEQTPVLDGQVVLLPVPQLLQVLVVDGRERIHAVDGRRWRRGYHP